MGDRPLRGDARAGARTCRRQVALKRASAEALPFKDGWFEAAVFRLVVHLLDRPRAFAETRRVLEPGGRVVLATFAPESLDRFWISKVFPAIVEIDRARFPTEAQLAGELADAASRPFAPAGSRRRAVSTAAKRSSASAGATSRPFSCSATRSSPRVWRARSAGFPKSSRTRVSGSSSPPSALRAPWRPSARPASLPPRL